MWIDLQKIANYYASVLDEKNAKLRSMYLLKLLNNIKIMIFSATSVLTSEF